MYPKAKSFQLKMLSCLDFFSMTAFLSLDLICAPVYRPSEDADDIYERKKVGLFQVAAVHSTFLVDMRNSDSRHLSFKSDPNIYSGLFKISIGFYCEYHSLI